MKKLTPSQAKMVIEFYSQQAAQETPDTTDWGVWDKHMWMSNHVADLAVERLIAARDWSMLLSAQLDAQTFDRDPAGYLNDRDYNDTESERVYMQGILEDVVSAAIDAAYRNSKAA